MLQRRRAGTVVPPVAVDRLPGINERVAVRFDLHEGVRPSRVEDVAPGVLVLSPPADAAGYAWRAHRGLALSIRWTSEEGLHEATGTVAEVVTEPVPMWTVRVSAVAPVRQRRQGVRLDVQLPAELRLPDDRVLEIVTLDLSEGGMRVRLPERTQLQLGMQVAVHFVLDDTEIAGEATVVRLDEKPGGERGAGLRFEDMPDTTTTLVRRYIFAEQLRRRALLRA